MAVFVKCKGDISFDRLIRRCEFFFSRNLEIEGRSDAKEEMVWIVIEIVLEQTCQFNSVKSGIIILCCWIRWEHKLGKRYFIALQTIKDGRSKVKPVFEFNFHT